MEDSTGIRQTFAPGEIDDDPPLPRELMTDAEIEAAKSKEIAARNNELARRRLHFINRKRGIPTPKDGDVLHVQLQRGLERRTRGGVKFSKGPSVPVRVLDESDEEVGRLQRAGQNVVSIHGAEMLHDDDSLIVRYEASHEADLESANARVAAAEARAEAAEAELLRQRKLWEAHKNAPESTDGRPTRLDARNQAEGKASRSPAQAVADAGADPFAGASKK